MYSLHNELENIDTGFVKDVAFDFQHCRRMCFSSSLSNENSRNPN